MQRKDDQAWTDAWGAAYPETPPTAAPAVARAGRRGPRTRSVLLATGLLVLGITPFAVGATGDVLREGQRNGTATRETEIIGNIAETNRSKGGYTTRQSNLSRSGGGAIYGCRSRSGAGNNPCLRGVNLSTGLAFSFTAQNGNSAGVFTVGSGGDSKRPFTTNATGVATGLNADRVDGQDAAQIIATARATPGLNAATVGGASAADLRTRWALVNEAGEIEEQSGGFTVVSRPGINNQPATNPNIYIATGGSLVGKGLNATTAIQNTTAPAAFDGETSVARCATAAVTCVPAGTNNSNTLVVRSLEDNALVASAPRRFYVEVTE